MQKISESFKKQMYTNFEYRSKKDFQASKLEKTLKKFQKILYCKNELLNHRIFQPSSLQYNFYKKNSGLEKKCQRIKNWENQFLSRKIYKNEQNCLNSPIIS